MVSCLPVCPSSLFLPSLPAYALSSRAEPPPLGTAGSLLLGRNPDKQSPEAKILVESIPPVKSQKERVGRKGGREGRREGGGSISAVKKL